MMRQSDSHDDTKTTETPAGQGRFQAPADGERKC